MTGWPARGFSASFVDARAVTPVGLEQSETCFNCFTGDDESLWREGGPAYEPASESSKNSCFFFCCFRREMALYIMCRWAHDDSA